jgi:uncharacterized membrane protein
MCLDRLGEFLVRLSQCNPPTPFRLDEKGRLRLIDHPPQFPELVGLVMDPIRTYGKGDPSIVRKALHILMEMAKASVKPEFLEPMISHARLLAMEGAESSRWDKPALDSAHRAFLDAKDKAFNRLAAET